MPLLDFFKNNSNKRFSEREPGGTTPSSLQANGKVASIDLARSFKRNAEELFKQKKLYKSSWYLNRALMVDQNLVVNDAAQAVVQNPLNPETLYWRAMVNDLLGEHNKAINDFTRALEVDPKFACALIQRAFAQQRIGKTREAFRDLEQAIVVDDSIALAHFYMGQILYMQTQYDAALQEFTIAIQLDPGSAAGAYVCRGELYYLKGRNDDAHHEFSRAIQLEPWQSEAFFGRGIVLRDQRRYREAIEDFKRAIVLEPNDAQSLINYAFCRQELRYPLEEVLKDYTKGIQLEPSNSESYFFRGSAYLGMREYTKALADTNRAIDLLKSQSKHQEGMPSEKAVYYYQRGLIQHELGNPEAALGDFDSAISIDPKLADAYAHRAFLNFYEFYKYDKAIADLTKALELDELVGSETYQLRSLLMYRKKARLDLAMVDINQAIKLDNLQNSFYYLNRAILQFAFQKDAFANEDLSKARQLENSVIGPLIDLVGIPTLKSSGLAEAMNKGCWWIKAELFGPFEVNGMMFQLDQELTKLDWSLPFFRHLIDGGKRSARIKGHDRLAVAKVYLEKCKQKINGQP